MSRNDLIYTLCNRNRTQEKFDIFIYPSIKRGKQAIIITPHVSTIYYEVKQLKQLNINCVAYTSRLQYIERDATREKFCNGEIQFLYATPQMYFRNSYFRKFVKRQVLEGNLSYIVFDDAKFLFEYNRNTPRFESIQNISKLKDVRRDHQWVVIADAECEDNMEDIANVLHLQNPRVMNIKYNGHKNPYHKCQYDLFEETYMEF